MFSTSASESLQQGELSTLIAQEWVRRKIQEIQTEEPHEVSPHVSEEMIAQRLKNVLLFPDYQSLLDYACTHLDYMSVAYLESEQKKDRLEGVAIEHIIDRDNHSSEYYIIANDLITLSHESRHIAEFILEYISYDKDKEKMKNEEKRLELAKWLATTAFFSLGELIINTPDMHVEFYQNVITALVVLYWVLFIISSASISFYTLSSYELNPIEIRARKSAKRDMLDGQK